MQDNTRIPEAQVALSLALWLIREGLVRDTVSVSIDGAMVSVHGIEIFDPVSFLSGRGWDRREPENKWSGSFVRSGSTSVIEVHSRPGVGDVSAVLTDGRRFIAECKKGYSASTRSNPEYPLMREALGQILTMRTVRETDVLAVAVPSNSKSLELARKWRRAPLIMQSGIKILTVDADGQVDGFQSDDVFHVCFPRSCYKLFNEEVIMAIRTNLLSMVGTIPEGPSRIRRMRTHQGWWRAFVLGVEPGERLDGKGTACNMLAVDSENLGFLTDGILEVVNRVVNDRNENSAGAMEEKRLRRNLLSSQPLCFNIFAPLHADKALALRILQSFFPKLTEITDVYFEFDPKNYTADRSAFDVAIEGREGKKRVLIGLECKYTESFSPTEYKSDVYKRIFDNSSRFLDDYEVLTKSQYNQLFRNQLIAEAYLQHKDFDVVYTGLFCHEDDDGAQRVATEFQHMLRGGEECFRVITFKDFITAVQRLDVPFEVREWSMMLWVRYCATQLSAVVRA